MLASLIRETLDAEVHEDAVDAAMPTAVRCLVLDIELMPVTRLEERWARWHGEIA